MAIQQTEKVWHNGNLIPWDDAQIHVMSHVVHYGFSVFEGVGSTVCPAVLRFFAPKNICRGCWIRPKFIASMSTTRVEDLIEWHGRNGQEQQGVAMLHPAHRAPRLRRSGVNPFHSPTEVYICNYPWGKYLTVGFRTGRRRLRILVDPHRP